MKRYPKAAAATAHTVLLFPLAQSQNNIRFSRMASLEMSPKSLLDMDSDASSGDSAAGTTTTISSASSRLVVKEHDLTLDSNPKVHLELAEAFSENVAAKIWRVAVRHLEQDVSFTYSPSPSYKSHTERERDARCSPLQSFLAYQLPEISHYLSRVHSIRRRKCWKICV